MVKTIFFDAAGTLFDTREPVGHYYARLARQFGFQAGDEQVGQAFRRIFAAAPRLAFGVGRHPADLRRLEKSWWRERVRQTFEGLGRFDDFDRYFEALFSFFADPANWKADPEAAPLLARLKDEGISLGVVSNFDARVYRILQELGLRQFFDSITISSEAGYAKPDPEIFEIALGKHDLTPEQALHVGDSAALDLVGGVAARVKVILLTSKPETLSDQLPKPLATIRSLAEVPEVLARGASLGPLA